MTRRNLALTRYTPHLVLIAALLFPVACANDPSAEGAARGMDTTLLEDLSRIKGRQNIAIVQAALFLQTFFVQNPKFAGTLKDYDLRNPVVKEVTTNLGRTYILASFPTRKVGDSAAAQAIFQVCSNNIILVAEGGAGLYGDQFIEGFVEASKDSSAGYFENDVCEMWYGGEM
jgi:hypothetical protein